MEDSTAFCNDLRRFCDHIQSTCYNLKNSFQQHRIHHESSLKFVLEGLERRVASANKKVEVLNSLTMETVSFQELLGHCSQLYQQNEQTLGVLEDRLKECGYVPGEIEMEDEPLPSTRSLSVDNFIEEMTLSWPLVPFKNSAKPSDFEIPATSSSTCSVAEPISHRNADTVGHNSSFLQIDSLRLQDLGLSDASLAALASEENIDACSREFSPPSHSSLADNMSTQGEDSMEKSAGKISNEVITILPDKLDYDKEPSWVRSLVSWEDLNNAVDKINNLLSDRSSDLLSLADLESLDLGPKLKSYLVLLSRMNKLTLEHQEGVTYYRIKMN